MEFQENLNKKWRWQLFKICVVLAATGTAAEIVIYLYDSANSVLFLPLPLYRARFIYMLNHTGMEEKRWFFYLRESWRMR